MLSSLGITAASAQRNIAGTPEIKLALDRLNVLGSVLMIAAHPDDENTALLAYFARGRKLRTAYLSLTRGEGGQNLIGSEQGDALGVIRTQELLAARRIDGAEQYFTRAIDFGFSKTSEETLAKWGREKILSDVVWNIRRFRPDVIVLRFSGTPRDGHGQHQVSAILGKEAFFAAADKTRFPEQLQWVEPWQAKRVMFNVFAFTPEQERQSERIPNRLEIDTGEFDPVLGHSYTEIAGMSRSMHRSQGMGAPERKGSAKNYLVLVAGEPAAKDLFEGVDTSWNRVPGGAAVGAVLAEAAKAFQPEHPEKTIPLLLKAKKLVAGASNPWAALKRGELDEAAALCAELWLDASADRAVVVPGSDVIIRTTVLKRSHISIKTAAGNGGEYDIPYNAPKVSTVIWKVPHDQRYSQPYWLEKPKDGETYTVERQELIGLPENPPLHTVPFRLSAEGVEIQVARPVAYRYVDHVQGEMTRPLAVVPPVGLELSEKALLFPESSARKIEVHVRANVPNASGEVRVESPAGWTVTPSTAKFQMTDAGELSALTFMIVPPRKVGKEYLHVVASAGGRRIQVGMRVISFPHIPPQTIFPAAVTELVRANVKTIAKRIGYVMGAGDEMPDSLRQLGCDVTLLSSGDLAHADLTRFDAIVTGVRAYNVRADLRSNQSRLLAYVNNGGTMVVQYNVLEGGFMGGDPTLLSKIGPYPITIGRERVSVEQAQVEFDPRHPLLQSPNQINAHDFEAWVQERGLYFATGWDKRYQPLFELHDPGEKPLHGGTLFARYGKGTYIFTALSWFRQLPSGVPGAYRIFANFLSAAGTAE